MWTTKLRINTFYTGLFFRTALKTYFRNLFPGTCFQTPHKTNYTLSLCYPFHVTSQYESFLQNINVKHFRFRCYLWRYICKPCYKYSFHKTYISKTFKQFDLMNFWIYDDITRLYLQFIIEICSTFIGLIWLLIQSP